MNLENPSTFVEAMTAPRMRDAKFTSTWGPETLGYCCRLNSQLISALKDERDTAMRTLMRDVRFRQALSHATDREGIAQAIMRGPFLRAYAGGLYPGSPEFDQEFSRVLPDMTSNPPRPCWMKLAWKIPTTMAF